MVDKSVKPVGRGRPVGRSEKGKATKERILSAAMTLFAGQGFNITTLRQIAEAAGVSPGLTYKYFSSKEHLIVTWYLQHTTAMQSTAAELPAGSMSKRFFFVIDRKLALLAPYRSAIPALIATAIDPTSNAYLFSPENDRFKQQSTALLRAAVDGSTAQIPACSIDHVASLMFFVQLAYLYLWSIDTSPGQSTSAALLKRGCALMNVATPLINIPKIQDALAWGTSHIEDLLAHASTPKQPTAPEKIVDTERGDAHV